MAPCWPLLSTASGDGPMAVSLPRQLPPPETPRLDTEGELAAALHELEGLGRLRSASVMGLLPTPRDYAAREAARHCRSLADHLLDADPMARAQHHRSVTCRHLAPCVVPHDTPRLGRCGGLRSLSRGAVTRPGSAGRGSARRASARCGGSTTSSCARCSAAPPNPHPTTPTLHASLHRVSTVSSSQAGALLDGLSHALRRTLCLEGARLRARLRVRATRFRSVAHASIASHPRTGWRR